METTKGPFEILYQDDDFVAIDKPSGYHVHPPERQDLRIPRRLICLSLLRAQVGRYVYPVHRLDVATSGILLWAFNKDAARKLNDAFLNQQIKKRYLVVVRGYTPEVFHVDQPLELDSTGDLVPAHTDFKRLSQIEWDIPVGKKFPKARYSFLEAYPRTGRYHQIRRHLNRISNPVIGDTDHGDSHHNRFFRERLGLQGLCLRAVEVNLQHPTSGEGMTIHAPRSEKWDKLQEIFQGRHSPT